MPVRCRSARGRCRRPVRSGFSCSGLLEALWTLSTITCICGRCPLRLCPMPAGDERSRRPRGAVRSALVEAGLELARSGGPDAVVLREVTRMVGVVPNTAYRHFLDRDALLAAVRDKAVKALARRMADRISQVSAGPHTPTGARLR